MIKGLITLDIDGTLTAEKHTIPIEVIEYLGCLESEGWKICLITGRGVFFANPIFEQLPFPFLAAIHNGALLYEMPIKKVLKTLYLGHEVIPIMEEICAMESTGFVLYTGPENNSQCYYRPQYFEKSLQEYLKRRATITAEPWIAVESFDNLPVNEYLAFKCFGTQEALNRIVQQATAKLSIHFPVIKDGFGVEMYIAQATHGEVSKGHAVSDIKTLLNCTGPVIAAGDDLSDVPLLNAADFKIAMAGAPIELQNIADYQAPSAAEQGLIPALKMAMAWVKQNTRV